MHMLFMRHIPPDEQGQLQDRAKGSRSELRSFEESEVEAFFVAILGYLRSDNNGTHIVDIGELPGWEDEDVQSSQWTVQPPPRG